MNDSRITHPSQALDQALEMAALGYKIIPIPTGQKFPKGLAEWQKKATNDRDQIIHWWGSGEAGIGWAMGLQPSGVNLVAIDVDVANDKPGKANFEAFAAEHDFADALRSTIMSVTGSGGFHFVFQLPEGVTLTNGILLPGVDIRGEGGFIVIPPSVHPNGKQYRWAREGSAPWSTAPAPCPEAVIVKLSSPHEKDNGDDGSGDGDNPEWVHTRSVSRGTSDETSPADWIRENHLGIAEMLHVAGWTYMESKGNDEYWCRPGKNPRDGHSAILHDDGPLVIWSTTAPMEFWRVGRANPDGSRSLSPFEVYAAIDHAGDVRAAASHIRRHWMERPHASEAARNTEAGAVTSQSDRLQTPLNLPPEFWTARPWLTQVRDAAWSRLVSPDATLIGVLARFSALVPATLRIPPMIGSDSTFDFIGCVVASSSGGKTISNSVADELVPCLRTDVLLGLPVGSGEGLVQAFMADDVDDDGKKTGTQSYRLGPKAVHFTIDEGTALMEQQNRKGTTIIQTLCSAWSGATLGQVNASKETHRIVPAKTRRVACVINMQTANGHLLLEEHVIAVGLPQRIVFSTAHDETIPDEAPAWPGPLDVPMLPIIAQPHVLEYDPRIVSLLQDRRRAVARGKLVQGPIDGHAGLQQLKLAGLMELLGGGDYVSWETWELAGMVIASSTSVRDRLVEVKHESDRERIVTQGTQTAFRELAAEDVKERQKVARLADTISARAVPEGTGLNVMRKAVTSSETKHRFQAALDMAMARGSVTTDGERVFKA